jgi:hypothetical protein
MLSRDAGPANEGLRRGRRPARHERSRRPEARDRGPLPPQARSGAGRGGGGPRGVHARPSAVPARAHRRFVQAGRGHGRRRGRLRDRRIRRGGRSSGGQPGARRLQGRAAGGRRRSRVVVPRRPGAALGGGGGPGDALGLLRPHLRRRRPAEAEREARPARGGRALPARRHPGRLHRAQRPHHPLPPQPRLGRDRQDLRRPELERRADEPLLRADRALRLRAEEAFERVAPRLRRLARHQRRRRLAGPLGHASRAWSPCAA